MFRPPWPSSPGADASGTSYFTPRCSCGSTSREREAFAEVGSMIGIASGIELACRLHLGSTQLSWILFFFVLYRLKAPDVVTSHRQVARSSGKIVATLSPAATN